MLLFVIPKRISKKNKTISAETPFGISADMIDVLGI